MLHIKMEYKQNHNYKTSGLIVFVIGVIMCFMFFQRSAGSIGDYINNMNNRVSNNAGSRFLRYYWIILDVGVSMIYAHYLKKRAGWKALPYMAITLCLIFFYGARSPIFLSIISWCVIKKYYSPEGYKADKVGGAFKYVVLFAGCVVVFVGFVAWRQSDATQLIQQYGIIGFLQHTWDNAVMKSLMYFNNMNKYLFVFGTENFGTIDTLWYGSSFRDLFTGIIPSSIYPNKPPLEEGVYIYNIINGVYVKPSVPASSLYMSAWPIDTIGVMYVNFHYIGCIFGAYIVERFRDIFIIVSCQIKIFV